MRDLPARRHLLNYLGALTGLRFFAALLVVFHHIPTDYAAWAPTLFHALAARGYVGVDVFFVLSGFILTYTYLGAGAGRELDETWS